MRNVSCRSSAVLSEDRVYRYWLERRWGDGPVMVFVMLNPSTADAETDDRTIRRCIGFAKREGCGGLVVVNLMAYRATDPDNLPDDDLCARGPLNSQYLRDAARLAGQGPVVVAWGANARAERFREEAVNLLTPCGGRVMALRVTKGGPPGHPLYVKADADLVPFAAG